MTFTAIFNIDGAPVDIERQVAAMPVCTGVKVLGRSGQAAFIAHNDGNAAAACAGPESADGRHWIIGRIRLDGRDDLIAKLGQSLPVGLTMRSDPHLCLAAYAKWGDDFLQHLAGDFCFALWDDEQQRMICARDQLGVRPLFSAETAGRWLVSDDLVKLAAVPQLGDQLDTIWIADFLTAAFCADVDRTVYAAIKRVPPAHCLRLGEGRGHLSRYWQLQVTEPLLFADPGHYCDEFHARLSSAIRDRMPPDRVGIKMSGGLDSTTLAAKAVEVTGDASRVVANSVYIKSLIQDDEIHFSRLVATRLRIQQDQVATDELFYDPQWQSNSQALAEPNLMTINQVRVMEMESGMANQANVWFYGEGPDNALTFDWRPYLGWLWRERRWTHLARAGFDYLRFKSTREWINTFAISKRLGIASDNIAAAAERSAVPDWVDADFARKTELDERLMAAERPSETPHPWKPRAMDSLTSAIWPGFFEEFDPALTKTPLNWQHPFLDLRVLEFMLAVPPIPWCRRKRLIRVAMQGRLPDEVLQRDKTPLRQDPLAEILRRHPLPRLAPDSPITQFVVLEKLPFGSDKAADLHQLLKVSILDHWLRLRRA